jgi:hypothetical protein
VPLLNGSDSAALAADYLEGSARSLVIAIDVWSAACDALSLDAYNFVTDFLLRRLVVIRDRWVTARGVTGVAAAMRARFPGKWASDAACDTELLNCNNGMTTLVDWIVSNVQSSILTDANGWLDVLRIVNNAEVHRTITNSGQLSSLKTQLQTLRSLLSS